jgi:hypothetical protein
LFCCDVFFAACEFVACNFAVCRVAGLLFGFVSVLYCWCLLCAVAALLLVALPFCFVAISLLLFGAFLFALLRLI